MIAIRSRQRILVNTDPQRRCYDGGHFSSKWEWTAWAMLETGPFHNGVAERLQFWRDLNSYAVSCRGEEARREFEAYDYMGQAQGLVPPGECVHQWEAECVANGWRETCALCGLQARGSGQ